MSCWSSGIVAENEEGFSTGPNLKLGEPLKLGAMGDGARIFDKETREIGYRGSANSRQIHALAAN